MQIPSLKNSTALVEKLWDLWCLVSVVGIWPRFIEPRLIITSHHTIPIANLPRELEGLKIVQISDLHISYFVSKRFLNRIIRRINKQAPDLIVFTGDLLSYSDLCEEAQLQEFLSKLYAPMGVYVIFGNHDYAEYVSLGEDGLYHKVQSHLPAIMRGFARLFSIKDTASNGERVCLPIAENEPLKALIKKAGVHILHNETVQIGKKNALINLTGLGDIMTHQCQPNVAFSSYDYRAPGIVLSHNPDSYQELMHYPGDLFLFGHTHGGQVNLPYIWKKVTPIKNQRFKSGLFHLDSRYLYVNRGLGATFPFRWFAPPEIAVLTLSQQGVIKVPIWQRIFPQETTQEAVCGTS